MVSARSGWASPSTRRFMRNAPRWYFSARSGDYSPEITTQIVQNDCDLRMTGPKMSAIDTQTPDDKASPLHQMFPTHKESQPTKQVRSVSFDGGPIGLLIVDGRSLRKFAVITFLLVPERLCRIAYWRTTQRLTSMHISSHWLTILSISRSYMGTDSIWRDVRSLSWGLNHRTGEAHGGPRQSPIDKDPIDRACRFKDWRPVPSCIRRIHGESA